MPRLISVLAAGLLAAGTAVAGVGLASASTTGAHDQTTCLSGFFFHVTKSGVDYYLGTPVATSSGAAAILKPSQNRTTAWKECAPSGASVVLENRGLALTSRATSSGADVTVEPPGDGGNGFASQRWIDDAAGPMVTFQNVKTGLYLRVRNSGPIMYQPVTTGSSFTVWLMP
jgi:hypothetical protein